MGGQSAAKASQVLRLLLLSWGRKEGGEREGERGGKVRGGRLEGSRGVKRSLMVHSQCRAIGTSRGTLAIRPSQNESLPPILPPFPDPP